MPFWRSLTSSASKKSSHDTAGVGLDPSQSTASETTKLVAAGQVIKRAVDDKTFSLHESRQLPVTNYLNTISTHAANTDPVAQVAWSRPTRCELKHMHEVCKSATVTAETEVEYVARTSALLAVKNHAHSDWKDWSAEPGHAQGSERCWCTVKRPDVNTDPSGATPGMTHGMS